MTNLQEIWKDIPEFEGVYSISNHGRVKNIKSGLIKKPVIIAGYYYTGLCMKNRVTKSLRINRLVANAFLPNPASLPFVNHKDNNKLNNVVSNLEWCSHAGNMDWMIKQGRQAKGEKTGASKLTETDVLEIRKLRSSGMKYDDIALMFPVNKSVICAICNNKAWAHVTKNSLVE